MSAGSCFRAARCWELREMAPHSLRVARFRSCVRGEKAAGSRRAESCMQGGQVRVRGSR